MRKLSEFIGITALVAVIGFMTACPVDTDLGKNGGDGGTTPQKTPVKTPEKKPEDLTTEGRWSKWVDPTSTATLEYSVASDGVVTVTVGGTPETIPWDGWKANVGYSYTAKANAIYTYVFEAWTQSGTRQLHNQYYWDADTSTGLDGDPFPLTTTRKTYTIYGQKIPKNGSRDLAFHCALETGTFYIKILSITENSVIIPSKWQGTYTRSPYFNGDFDKITVNANGSVKIEFDGIDHPYSPGITVHSGSSNLVNGPYSGEWVYVANGGVNIGFIINFSPPVEDTSYYMVLGSWAFSDFKDEAEDMGFYDTLSGINSSSFSNEYYFIGTK